MSSFSRPGTPPVQQVDESLQPGTLPLDTAIPITRADLVEREKEQSEPASPSEPPR